MGSMYKLRIQAQCIRQEYKYDPLTQAELHDFFTKIYKPFGVESRIVKASEKRPYELEEISWEGETELKYSVEPEQIHEQIKAFLQETTENAPGLKVKTSWLCLDDYDEVIGDKEI